MHYIVWYYTYLENWHYEFSRRFSFSIVRIGPCRRGCVDAIADERKMPVAAQCRIPTFKAVVRVREREKKEGPGGQTRLERRETTSILYTPLLFSLRTTPLLPELSQCRERPIRRAYLFPQRRQPLPPPFQLPLHRAYQYLPCLMFPELVALLQHQEQVVGELVPEFPFTVAFFLYRGSTKREIRVIREIAFLPVGAGKRVSNESEAFEVIEQHERLPPPPTHPSKNKGMQGK